MRLLQHNCRKTYTVTVAALEAGLELGVELACLQEPYFDMGFQHGGYQIYWPETGSLQDQRVAVAIRCDLVNKVIVEARTDLLNHPYLMVMRSGTCMAGSRRCLGDPGIPIGQGI